MSDAAKMRPDGAGGTAEEGATLNLDCNRLFG
jgi:hypothetical protein